MTIPVFPALPGRKFPLRRPTFDTVKEDSLNGARARYPNRSVPRWQWELPLEFLGSCRDFREVSTDLEALVSLFASCYGQAYPFAYEEPTDRDANCVVGTGDGSNHTFQLLRSFGGGPPEPVLLPVSVAMFSNGTLVAASAYTVGAYGAVTFATAPANGAVIAWAGRFRWLCRFDQDQLDLQQMFYQFWSLDKITFSNDITP